MLLFRYKRLYANPAQEIWRTAHATLLSSLFLTTYQTTVKGVQVLLREDVLQGDEPWKSVLCGFLTGFSCLFEKPTRVNELMLYCCPMSFTMQV